MRIGEPPDALKKLAVRAGTPEIASFVRASSNRPAAASHGASSASGPRTRG
jgi:hypothetical protein